MAKPKKLPPRRLVGIQWASTLPGGASGWIEHHTQQVGECRGRIWHIDPAYGTAETRARYAGYSWDIRDKKTKSGTAVVAKGHTKALSSAKRAVQRQLEKCPYTKEEMAKIRALDLDPGEGRGGFPEDYYAGPALGRARRKRR